MWVPSQEHGSKDYELGRRGGVYVSYIDRSGLAQVGHGGAEVVYGADVRRKHVCFTVDRQQCSG